MHLLKLIHFAALSLWCGTLIYLPALIVATNRGGLPTFHPEDVLVVRWTFTLVSSPAALLAIVSGTALFVGIGPAPTWLVAKLSAVAMLVLGHLACGYLILRLNDPPAQLERLCALLAAAIALSAGATLWLVLARPL